MADVSTGDLDIDLLLAYCGRVRRKWRQQPEPLDQKLRPGSQHRRDSHAHPAGDPRGLARPKRASARETRGYKTVTVRLRRPALGLCVRALGPALALPAGHR